MSKRILAASEFAKLFWIEAERLPQESQIRYHLYAVHHYSDEIDVPRLKNALQALVNTNYNFRSNFLYQKEALWQIIHEQLDANIVEFIAKDKDEADTFLHELSARPYNLEKDPLFRFAIVKIANTKTLSLLVHFHHIILDGTQYDFVINQIAENYAIKKSLTLDDNAEINQLESYLSWERSELKSVSNETVINQLRDYPLVTSLPNKSNIKLKEKNTKKVDWRICYIDGELYQNLKLFATNHKYSIFNILKVTWGALLAKYSNQEQVILGYSFNTRGNKFRTIKGSFVNNVYEVIDLKNQATEAIANAQKQVIKALRTKQHLISPIQIRKHLDTSRINIAISMATSRKEGPFPEQTLVLNEFPYPQCGSDAIFYFDDNGENIIVQYSFIDDLFEYHLIENMHQHFCNLLKRIITNPEHSLLEISILGDEEYQQLIYLNNQMQKNHLPSKTIIELFENQVEKTPNAVALVYENIALTYQELNEKSNQFARYLLKKYQGQIETDTLIAICIERNVEMVIAILGTLKAGAAYIPIDPEYPPQRIESILQDSKTQLLLTNENLTEKLISFSQATIIAVDQINYANEPTTSLNVKISSSALAYVIYTSGTTGKPKGVMITHANLFNYLTWANKYYELEKCCGALVHSSIAFDLTVTSLFTPLIAGKTSIVVAHAVDGLLEFLNQNKSSHVIKLTPSHLRLIQEKLKEKTDLAHTFVVGGEALFAEDLRNLSESRIINEYGPTEATVGCVVYEVDLDKDKSGAVLIGKAIDQTKLYVLDKKRHPVPIGIIGELYIGGDSVARGYLNQPNLTAERFIANPFVADDRLYKTGDLVRWLADGNLEYIGRNDTQIKIRGYRIELHEIENVLLMHPNIQQCAVMVKERASTKYLIAYYTADKSISVNNIIDYLSRYLPDYMIPSKFMQLKTMPMTVNGKVHQQALPEIDFEINQYNYVAPRNTLEVKLCKIWQSVLGVDKVGVQDDFFRIGGDSIVSIQLVNRLRDEDLPYNVRDIFNFRTIEKLAQNAPLTKVKILEEQGQLTGTFDLLPIQQWFFEQQFLMSQYWNQSFLVKVPALDVDKLKQVIPQLVSQHDILRVTFNGNQQTYHSTMPIPELKIIDYKQKTEQALIQCFTDWQSQFNLEKGPLWQIAYVHGYADQSARLYFAFHHLIMDTVSWRILIEDIKILYTGNTLPRKNTSYRQWVDIIKSYVPLKEELEYWQNQIKDQIDYVGDGESSFAQIKLTAELTRQLLQQANQAYHTEINHLLLSALAYALRSWHQNDVSFITLEGHGREQLQENIDLNRTIGWFTTQYPIKLQVAQDIASSIKTIKENIIAIPHHGVGYGAVQKRYFTQPHLPKISFNYLGQFNQDQESWCLTTESAGISIHPNNKDSNIVNINGIVIDGELHFYIHTQLNATKTQSIAHQLQQSLTEIISHCIDKVGRKEIEYTVSDFSTIHISQNLLEKLEKQYTIEDIYPAHSLQQGFIYHVLNQSEDDAYRVQILLDYPHLTDPDKFKQAWKSAIHVYPGLRIAFNWDEELIQIITSTGNLNWFEYDISSHSNPDEAIIAIQQQDRIQPYDLTIPTQMRLHLIKRDENMYTLIFSHHHILMGGWSVTILLNYVHACYEDLLNERFVLQNKRKNYLDVQKYFSIHQNEMEVFWKQKIDRIEGVNDLNPLLDTTVDLDQVKSIKNSCTAVTTISDGEYQKLRDLIQQEGLTLNVLLQFAWHKLIHVYTHDRQTVVGMTTSTRNINIAGVEDSIGLYINTLPLIINWEDKSIRAQLRYIQDEVVDITNYSYINLTKLQKAGQRLFHSISVFENYPLQDTHNTLKPTLRGVIEKLDYPFTLVAYEHNDSLQIQLKFAAEYITQKKAQQLLRQIKIILDQIPKKLTDSHQSLQLLNVEEYNLVVNAWNNTYKPYPKNITLIQLFEEQVVKTPDQIAVIFRDKQLTYQELNRKSNQLAHYIQRRYSAILQPDTLIAICLERSLEMIIGILAILKAGAAYVPIDPSYPDSRREYILKDCQAKLILSQGRLIENAIRLDEDWYLVDAESSENLPSLVHPQHLAYVIYTSGSTGQPKGAMNTHQGIVNRLIWMQEAYQLNLTDKVLQKTSFSFDVSVWEFFWPLITGAQLIIAKPGEHKDSEALVRTIIENEISTVHFVPSMLETFLEQENVSACVSLRRVICSGEALNSVIKDKFFRRLSAANLYNLYGPTEAAIDVSAYDCRQAKGKVVAIGKPIANIQLYILDSSLNPMPIGVSGELYIGGVGLARGYLNRPELTAERFIDNPFEPNSKLYKTGDLARWLADGNIEYIGRNDFQVKIRGFRIELGEIEYLLLSYPVIKQAAVVVKSRQDNSKYLVAYYVSEQSINHSDLISYLKPLLPDYMIPSLFVHLIELPLNANGKLDRNALPHPEFKIDPHHYIAPRNDLEHNIAEIWQNLLGLQQIGMHDDFFKIGGDSILSIQLTSRLRNIGLNFSVKDILNYRTIEDIAAQSLRINKIKIESEQGQLHGTFPLLPIQRWFFRQNWARPNHWNQSFLIVTPELDIQKLKTAFIKLAAHHDILRIKFKNNQQQTYYSQMIMPELKVLNRREINDQELNNILTEWQAHFDLQHGPLWQAGYIAGYDDNSARIYIAAHHLLIDGVSWRILTEDLKAIYDERPLPSKTSSYRQWVETVNAHVVCESEKQYWMQQTENMPAYQGDNEYHCVEVHLNRQQTRDLLNTANSAFHTEINHLLLTGVAYSLSAWHFNKNVYITMESHGREHLNDLIDVSRTVGWFTTLFPVKLTLKESLSDTIKSIKETLRKIPINGLGYSTLSNDYVLPKIIFNYLGQFNQNDAISSEDAGICFHPANKDLNIININCIVIDGILRFTISSQLTKEKTDKIASTLREYLIQIIEVCQHKVLTKATEFTASDFSSVKISQGLVDKLQQQYIVETIVPANSLQQGFIYNKLNNPHDDAYQIQLLFDYHVSLDRDKLKQAWAHAVRIYPALRTCFNWDEELIQIITRQDQLIWIEHDITNYTDKNATIAEIQKADRAQAFDLTKPHLLRVHLIKQRNDLFTMLVHVHHIIIDGWSIPLLLKQVHVCYSQLKNNEALSTFREQTYIEAQHYYFKNKYEITQYWQQQIKKYETINDINPLLSAHANLDQPFTTDNKIYKHTLTRDVYSKLKLLTQQQGVTLNVLLQFAWHKLIATYTHDQHTIVGTTVSGRNIPINNIEKSVGLYINTLPLQVEWSNTLTANILEQIHQSVTDINNYSYFNLVDLQQESKRIFHTLFVFENYPMPEESGDLLAAKFRSNKEKLDYLLALIAYEKDNTLNLDLNYAADYLTEEKATRLIQQLEIILNQLPTKINQPHSAITLLHTLEYDLLVKKQNSDNLSLKRNSIIQLFEKQVEKNPDATAVVYEERNMSYRELNQRANQLASYIRTTYPQYCAPDSLIMLCLEKDIVILLGILAILKVGAAYVPVSPNLPQERLNYIIDDTAATLAITQSYYSDKFGAINCINLDEIDFYQEPYTNFSVQSHPDDLAYVIYTSGTTGKPKGVLQTHGNVSHLLAVTQEYYHFTHDDVWTLFHSYAFDFSVWEIWGALLHGGKLVIPSEDDIHDMHRFYALCQRQHVTVLNQTPTAFDQFVEMMEKPLPSLRYVIFGGESLNMTRVRAWWNKIDTATKLINMYGITETTVHVTLKELSRIDDALNNNIGKPLTDWHVYVLDSHLNPLPIGVMGELYIGGAGVARGYLNQPELTAQRFIANPFIPGDRLYKSGDLARWLPNGDLEYIGRNDFQVKIRGFRIELKDIESALLAYPGITQCAVLVKEVGETKNKCLISYYVAHVAIPEAELMQYLACCLPEYMMPHAFVHLTAFPQTHNGKLNRDALPEIKILADEQTYVAGRDELEIKLCQIWQDLLEIPQIGVQDNFFKLGGNSILAIQLTHRMSQGLQQHIAVSTLFKEKTIANIAVYLREHHNLIHIEAQNLDQARLSYAQEGLWFIEKFERGTVAYNVPILFSCKEDINISRLFESINALITRHAILRTVIKADVNGIYHQHLMTDPIHVVQIELTQQDLMAQVKQNSTMIFDLENHYPIRIWLYKTEQGYYLHFNIHHIVFDGWSLKILLNDLIALYHQATTLPQLEIQYLDFVNWQRDYLKGELLQKKINYWKNKLNNMKPFELFSDKMRPSHFDYAGSTIPFSINLKLSQTVRQYARENETTLFSVLLSAFYVLLNKYTSQNDIIIGTPVANRPCQQVENMIGYFVNSLVLRGEMNETISFDQLVKLTHDDFTEAQSHQDLPFDKLVEILQLDKDSSRHPIFQVVFGLDSFNEHKKLVNQVFKLEPISEYQVAKYDLSVFVNDSETQLHGYFNYAISLYHVETINRLISHYIHLLEQLLINPALPISAPHTLPLEQYTLLRSWNNTECFYSKENTVVELFEEQVAQNPSATAVVFNDQHLTYAELNNQANQLARYIQKNYHNQKGVVLSPNTLIAICIDKSLSMIVGIWGILKAGAAYVPIDPHYPQQRIDYILQDIGADIILCDNQTEALLPQTVGIINLDNKAFLSEAISNLVIHNSPQDLAYVIYTSGTTGNPKGVLINHESLVNSTQSRQTRYPTHPSRFLLVSSIAFDSSVAGIFWTLLTAGTLIIPERCVMNDIAALGNFIATHKISHLLCTPSLYSILVDSVEFYASAAALQCVIVAGESCSERLAEKHFKFLPHVLLSNEYGPTEGCVWSSNYLINSNEFQLTGSGSIPIGKAINNTKLYVLDSALNLVPIGAVGDLYISGRGLARGYLNLNDITEERFIRNPFCSDSVKTPEYARLYKTGDLVRWLPDGNLYYYGRNDFQVKIRGFRIELSEIESVLVSYPGIKNAAVIVNQQGESARLIAYYVSDLNISSTDLLNYLTQHLPDFMLPAAMMPLVELPLTVNGKLDQNALPLPEFDSSEGNYVAPRNTIQKQICELWQTLLGVKAVGIEDDFFRLGGNSILAIQICHCMSKILNRHIAVADLFQYKTIVGLIDSGQRELIQIKNYGVTSAPLSFSQERLWFIEQYEQGTNAYNVPILLSIQNMDVIALEESIKALVARHSAFRTIITHNESDEYCQQIHNRDIEIIQSNWDSLHRDINRHFDLTREYPIQVTVYRNTGKDYILINIHHIVFDGWSLNILLRELESLYLHYSLSAPLHLPTANIHYVDYALWQREYLKDERLATHLNFWLTQLNGYEPLSLPTDKIRPQQVSYLGESIKFSLTPDLSNKLRMLAKAQSSTLFTVMLSAFYVLLNKYSQQEDFVIGTSVANRQYQQLENIIGFFVNSVVLRASVKKTESLQSLIADTQQYLTTMQAHQELPFEKLVNALKPAKDASRHPVFQVLFGMQESVQSDLFSLHPIDDHYHIAKYDLSLFIDEHAEVLTGFCNYSTNLYFSETIQRLIQHYISILQQLVDQPGKKINDIQIITAEEYDLVIKHWNAGLNQCLKQKTLTQLFEEQVIKTPDRIALSFQGDELTYAELNVQSNQLAHYIQTMGLQSNSLIAICVERSIDMLIAILGVLKAGGAYVPLDPKYPMARLQYILQDSEVKLVLTQNKFRDRFDNIKNILLDEFSYQSYDTKNLNVNVDPNHLAYVIYTSGTTGQPKGVLQTQHNVVRLFSASNEYYQFNQNDVWSLFHSYVFDFSVWEIWGALLYGGKLAIPTDEEVRDFSKFYTFCQQQRVSILNQTPTAFYQFIEYATSVQSNLNFRYVIFGGESLNLMQLKPWWDQFGDYPKLVNMYGITETTVHVTLKELHPHDLLDKSLIGKPLSDMKVYILDDNLNPVPIGIGGELYIGGAGLAQGYLNRPELTKERFIANPYATENDKLNGYDRLYKTGDLARWRADGELEYLGRNDFQVKIRGYRIELNEIEKAILSHSDVKQCAVVVKKDQTSHYLNAYYVADYAIDSEILVYLKNKLPEYMLPNRLICLPELPRTINGKLDINALPEPSILQRNTYVAPKNSLERELCQILANILHLSMDSVGTHDDFFQLGGDSILVIRFVSKINKTYNSTISVRDIFNLKTIANLAEILSTINPSQSTVYEPFELVNLADYTTYMDDIEDIYPASYLQVGMLLESLLTHNGDYHNVFNYTIKAEFSQEKIISIWKQLIAKHALLRAKFIPNKHNGWDVVVHKNVDLNLKIYRNHNVNVLLEQEKSNKFDYHEPGLVRIIINDLGDTFNFIITSHHVIEDGWSMASLINEFVSAYRHGTPIINDIMSSYGEFVRDELNAISQPENIDFWRQYLDGINIIKNQWKFDQESSNTTMYNASFKLENDLAQQISETAKELKISIDSIFLLAYFKTLSFITNHSDITIGLVVNNRLEKEDGDKLFGLFLNTIPFRYRDKPDINFNDIFEQKLHLYKYKKLPYGYIKSLMQNDLYECAFNFIHFHIMQDNIDFIESYAGNGRTNIPFILNVAQQGNARFDIEIMAHDNYISKNYLEYFLFYYKDCLLGLLNQSPLKLNSDDFVKMTQTWNAPSTISTQKSLSALFEEQVRKTPDKVALYFQHQELTFHELNDKANQLAHYIKNCYPVIGSEPTIGLYLERSFDMLIAMLAILKIGAAYVPIDLALPHERLLHIVEDSRLQLILTQASLASHLDLLENIPQILLDDCAKQIKHEDTDNIDIIVKPENLAYIMYTSGSTGKPKGVMIEQKSVVRLVTNQNYIDMTHNDIIAQAANYAFDASTFEIWGALLNGAKLSLVEQEVFLNPHRFRQFVHSQMISILWLTTAYYNHLVDEVPDLFKNLKYLLIGGEALNPNKIAKLLADKENKPNYIINGYGPTENTTFTTTHTIESIENHRIPIGKPIHATQCYVLNNHLNPCPIGAIGELYVGGEGLARGYMNRSELTQQQFISNPFSVSGRLYKTGDLVRWLPNGYLEYIGRSDFQVKVRGFRIELGEIENALLTHPQINQAIVLVNEWGEDKQKLLIAYYVAEVNLVDEHLMRYLKSRLPDYMMPNAFVSLSSLPLTTNGKIDRLALMTIHYELNESYRAPRNNLEQKLCAIWAKLLGREKVGIQDDFFYIGGNSILCVRLLAELREENIFYNIKDIFELRTIERLALIESTTQSHELVTIVNSKADSIPLILLPPGDGGSESYLGTLCPRLPKNMKVVLIDNYYLKHKNDFNSFHALASYYVDLIIEQNIFAENKCFLGGWSMGAIVAYEMMIELEKRGITVLNNFMLDPIVPTLIEPSLAQTMPLRLYHNYYPQLSINPITVFKCTQFDEVDIISQLAVNLPLLGFNQVASNVKEYLLPCSHANVLLNEQSLDTIVDVLTKRILQQKLKKIQQPVA